MSRMAEIESAHSEVLGDIELARVAIAELLGAVGDTEKLRAREALHSAHTILGGCREKLDDAVRRGA